MDKLTKELDVGSFEELAFRPGHNACPGCGSTTAVRMVLNAIGKHAIFLVPASCASLYFNPSDTTSINSPVIHTLFPGCFAEAEGLAYALQLQERSEQVVVWAGDGCCYDIALGSLSGIAARGANVLVICNDNEGYQNTGGHQSTATPPDAATRTGRRSDHGLAINGRKDLIEIMAAHRVPYLATATIAYPEDLEAKVKKAAATEGFRLLLLLTPCVTWGAESRHSVKLSRLAVETGYFPLYEVEDGKHYRITHEPTMLPLDRFARMQKRFAGADLMAVRAELEEKWSELRFKSQRGRAPMQEPRPKVVMRDDRGL